MSERLHVVEVLPGYTVPHDGDDHGPGERILVPTSFARKWSRRGAVRVLDVADLEEGSDE